MSDTFTGETYDTLCNDAEEFLAKGSAEQARELLQKAISLIGTRPRGRSLLADTCMSMELWAEARSQLEILITLDEGNSNNNFRLAQVLEELGEYQLAQDNYSVVLDSDPKHHGAKVAIKRIETRSKDSGVNLADIFNSPAGNEAAEPEVAGEKDVKEGLQIFPDVQSDELFADSEEDEEGSVDKFIENLGLSANSTDEEEADVSELLESIGVSTSAALESAFGDFDGSGAETADSPEDQQGTPAEVKETRKAVPSLDEIFGSASAGEDETEAEPEAQEEPEAEEAQEPEAEPEAQEEPEVEEAQEPEAEPEAQEEPEAEEAQEPEAEPEAQEEPEAEEAQEPEAVPETEESVSIFGSDAEDTADSAGFSFSSSKTLEAIFNTPETEAEEAEKAEEEEPEAEEPEAEEAEKAEEEEPVAEEPEAEEAEKAEEEEPEAEEPEAEEAEAEEVVEKPAYISEQDADFSIDTWSPESGLLTIHMKSGTLSISKTMLSIYEKSMQTETVDDDYLELSGKGTFLLNCGSEKPLIAELSENMIFRKDAVALHTGTITAELLDIPDNDSLYVVKADILEKVVVRTDNPVRVILLGGNNRSFYVRTSSIMITDPEILLSRDGTPEGYTEVAGLGKVYLIE